MNASDAVYRLNSLTRDGTTVESRLNIDHLARVLAARAGDGLLLRPAFEWAA